MSDETQGLAETPAEVTTPAPVETPAVETTEATTEKVEATEPAVDELASDEQGEPKKNIPGSQKLKRRLQLIESDYEATASENAELRRRIEQFSQPQQEQGRPGVDREPKESDYPNDYFAFQDAKTAWNTSRAVRDEFARIQQAQQNTQTERQRREVYIERQESYEEARKEARERITDFDKVIASATDIKITNQELVDEIMGSDKAALIHYYLAKNPEKARELNGMKGKELAREIGRLERSVHLPQANKATGAQAPPSTPKGGAAQPVNLETADMATYTRVRAEQEKRRSS